MQILPVHRRASATDTRARQPPVFGGHPRPEHPQEDALSPKRLIATGQAPGAHQHLQAIGVQMTQALQYFEELGFAPPTAPVSSTPMPVMPILLSPQDRAALLQALDTLDIDLRARKMHAVKVSDSIQQQFGKALGGRLGGLAVAITALDFRKALQASLELRNNLADATQ